MLRASAQKSEAEWREQLTPEQYAVCRCSATERAFTGKYWNKVPGTYRCVACGAPLLPSATKYDSGGGWPSYWRPVLPRGGRRDRRR